MVGGLSLEQRDINWLCPILEMFATGNGGNLVRWVAKEFYEGAQREAGFKMAA